MRRHLLERSAGGAGNLDDVERRERGAQAGYACSELLGRSRVDVLGGRTLERRTVGPVQKAAERVGEERGPRSKPRALGRNVERPRAGSPGPMRSRARYST